MSEFGPRLTKMTEREMQVCLFQNSDQIIIMGSAKKCFKFEMRVSEDSDAATT